jgi:hypothetical protein
MKKLISRSPAFRSAAFLFAVGCILAQAQTTGPTLKVIYAFDSAGGPGSLTEVKPGLFLGIANIGNELFSITSAGKYTDVYDFPAAGNTVLGLAQALNGKTYGSAANSGPVTTFSELFDIARQGKVTTYSYNGTTQGIADAPPVQSMDDHLYVNFANATGITFDRLDYAGNPTVIYGYSGTGFPAFHTLLLGASGDFYGVWLPDNGTAGIYSVSTSGTFSWIVPPFNSGGNNNKSFGLIQASNGNLYGTLPEQSVGGTIYEVTLSGGMQTIYTFPIAELGTPDGLIEASDGKLYGTAEGSYIGGGNGYSSIFRIDPNSHKFETIFAMKGGQYGGCPCGLIQGSDGKIYGTALNLGTYGAGTIFVLDAGLPPPPPRIAAIGPTSGPASTKVLLWGRDMLGATAVSFNGTAATTFTVASSQGVWVDVPAGATNGPVTVTTPNGSYTSQESFTVE